MSAAGAGPSKNGSGKATTRGRGLRTRVWSGQVFLWLGVGDIRKVTRGHRAESADGTPGQLQETHRR